MMMVVHVMMHHVMMIVVHVMMHHVMVHLLRNATVIHAAIGTGFCIPTIGRLCCRLCRCID